MPSSNKNIAISLSAAVLSIGCAHAAGLERAPQSVDALFEAGTYAEVGYTYIAPDITGRDVPIGAQASSAALANMAEDFYSLNYAVKTDLSPKFRLAVMYDEPFGSEVLFTGANNFTAAEREGADQYTRVQVKIRNVTALLGYQLNDAVMAYAGPALQEVQADIQLRGAAFGAGNGYDNKLADDLAAGWVAGLSYAKPELGILAALTYRSEVDHKTAAYENVPLADMLGLDYAHVNPVTVSTPESFNLSLQTGLNQSTVLFAKARFIPWSDFEYRPAILDQSTQAALGAGKGLALVDYSKNQTAVEIGLGKKVLPRLAVAASALWDSGAGNPVTVLGPVEGYWGIGLAAKYDLSPKTAFSVGWRYLWFGDAQGATSDGQIVGLFENNTGYMAGVKLSYQSK